jgi:ABC-2 type transport system permease protein
MALYGLAPRYVGASWGALVACLILTLLGQILQFPQWSLNLSPFSHTPSFPAENIEALPLVILVTIAVGLIASGLVGIRRRDIE